MALPRMRRIHARDRVALSRSTSAPFSTTVQQVRSMISDRQIRNTRVPRNVQETHALHNLRISATRVRNRRFPHPQIPSAQSAPSLTRIGSPRLTSDQPPSSLGSIQIT
jgi:hypothetical protein